jgi:hypothetical protein
MTALLLLTTHSSLLPSATPTQAPAKPKTPYGEMLQYYLRMEPQLFHAAVDQQLQRLKEEKDAKEEAVRKSQEEESSTAQRSKSDLVLYQRMEEVSRAFGWLGGWLLGACTGGGSGSNARRALQTAMRAGVGVGKPLTVQRYSLLLCAGILHSITQSLCC